jgi:hypothetical protein
MVMAIDVASLRTPTVFVNARKGSFRVQLQGNASHVRAVIDVTGLSLMTASNVHRDSIATSLESVNATSPAI